ncbi:MAG: hypothetical protein Q9210_000556 [Variospora velana]
MRSSILPLLVTLGALVISNSIAAAQGADTCRDTLNMPKDADGYPEPEPTCWTRLGMDGWMRYPRWVYHEWGIQRLIIRPMMHLPDLNNYLLKLYAQYRDLKQDTSFSGMISFLSQVWPQTETDMAAQNAIIARLLNENKGNDANSAVTVINLTLLRAFTQFDTGGFLEIATGGGLLYNDM